MGGTNYSKGVALENSVRAKLRAKGWKVLRTAGSKSAIDLIALPVRKQSKYILFIQCKKETVDSSNLNIDSLLRGLDVLTLISLPLDKHLKDVIRYVVMFRKFRSRKIIQMVWSEALNQWKEVQII